MTKTYEQAYELVQKLDSYHHQMVYEKTARKPTLDILQKVAINVTFAQIAILSKRMQSLEIQSQARTQFGQIMSCQCCGDAHAIDQCPSHPKSIHYYVNFNQN